MEVFKHTSVGYKAFSFKTTKEKKMLDVVQDC